MKLQINFQSELWKIFSDCLFYWQVIAQTEPDTQIVVFSEGSVRPCAVSSEMTSMQVAAQLIQVRLVL